MTSSSGVMQHERQEEHSSIREVSSNVVEVTHDERKMKGKELTELKSVSDVIDEGMDVGRGVSGGDVSVLHNQRIQGEEIYGLLEYHLYWYWYFILKSFRMEHFFNVK